jgi:hypothetical protein
MTTSSDPHAELRLARAAFRAVRRAADRLLRHRLRWLYVFLFEELRIRLILWTRPRRLDSAAEVLAASGALDRAYSNVLHQRIRRPQDAARFYLASWRRGIDARKPFPGFHPGVYASMRRLDANREPLMDFLAAGHPSGPWCAELIEPSSGVIPSASGAVRCALHIHVYYPELLPRMLQCLLLNKTRPDLLVSVTSETAQRQVLEQLAGYPQRVLVRELANRGRDLAPLFTGFRDEIIGRYDIIGHMHTKKSPYNEGFGARWGDFLCENLLGGRAPMLDLILARMEGDTGIGMVFPDDPRAEGWRANRRFAEALAHRMGWQGLPDSFWFPMGSMFWARVPVLEPVWGLNLSWEDYTPEPVPLDGSMLHALERILGLCSQAAGLRNALTHVPGVSL